MAPTVKQRKRQAQFWRFVDPRKLPRPLSKAEAEKMRERYARIREDANRDQQLPF